MLWKDRFPFLSSSGKRKMVERLRGCLPSISAELGLSMEQLLGMQQLGCGNYGCTFLVPGEPNERNVLKVTADNLEADIIQMLMSWGEMKPPGIVRFSGIWRMGKCSHVGRNPAFKYTQQINVPPYIYTRHYRDELGTVRPLWLIQRESLDDVNAHLPPKMGVRKLKAALHLLYVYEQWYAFNMRNPGGRNFEHVPQQIPGIASPLKAYAPSYNEVAAALAPFRGEALLDAVEWLQDRSVSYFDFTKIANLGWRHDVGLVIRDIGFAATEMVNDEGPKVLNGLRRRR